MIDFSIKVLVQVYPLILCMWDLWKELLFKRRLEFAVRIAKWTFSCTAAVYIAIINFKTFSESRNNVDKFGQFVWALVKGPSCACNSQCVNGAGTFGPNFTHTFVTVRAWQVLIEHTELVSDSVVFLCHVQIFSVHSFAWLFPDNMTYHNWLISIKFELLPYIFLSCCW